MIVRSLKENSATWNVIGQDFGKNGVIFRVLDEETGTPYLLRENEVELIDQTIPSRWVDSRPLCRRRRTPGP